MVENKQSSVEIDAGCSVGNSQPLTLIAGPCVAESPEILEEIAQVLDKLRQQLGIAIVFKASIDKANRTSGGSFRGLGISKGLEMLAAIKKRYSFPLITDVHDTFMVDQVAEVVDVLQIPAFLCRQTDLVVAAARTGKPLLIKKGQFMAPEDMRQVLGKALDVGNQRVMLCERGTSFGYHNLVVDFRGLQIMKNMGFPVVMDATHAVQLPGGAGSRSGAKREFVPQLARCAVAGGIAGMFLETHPRPHEALSDGQSAVPLGALPALVSELCAFDRFVKRESQRVYLESDA